MRDFPSSSPTVVVGIDGSRTAVDAALWAVDEAVSRDIPLRLVYAIDPDSASGIDPQDAARDLAAAEVAVRYAYTAVESTDKPVKIEVEILQERPGRALQQASRWALMACVGAMGLHHSAHGRIGSTAAALAAAHCPVAIVRGGHPNSTGQRWVVAEVDESAASNGVLRRAVEEARLREAPLRVLTSWQSRFTDVHDTHAVPDGNRLAKSRLDRQVAQWRKRYPDLDVETMAVHGTTLKHLTDKAGSIQLLVVGHERARGIKDLIGPPGYASLHETACSVLICEPQNVL
jgi:nucleotide-binding universal stress UspA family protein